MLPVLDDAVCAARRTARGPAGTLRLGYIPGAALELTQLILTEFRDRHRDVVVEMNEFPLGDSSGGLASGAQPMSPSR